MHHVAPLMLAVMMIVHLFTAAPSSAQSYRTLTDDAQISLLTILPGDAIYSAYGHSAFRVHDPAQGLDLVFNYGTFDFGPLFAFEFAYGQLDYMLSVVPTPRAMTHYRAEERPVVDQVLNLTPSQEDAVFRFLQINAQPENRVYRYDFFFDNCSTRLRDVLVEVLGGAVHFDVEAEQHHSFRQLIDPYHGTFLDAGLDVLLGAPTDREATPWEMMFLPEYLLDAAERARISRGDEVYPLVAQRDTLFWIEGYTSTAPHMPWPAVLLWILFLSWGGVTLWQLRTQRTVPRLPDVLLFGTAGLIGLVICFLWFVSLHDVTARNWNLLWAWPTHAIAAAMIGRDSLRLRRYWQAAAVTALVVAATWWLWPQDLPAAALPLVLLIALRSGWHGLQPARDAAGPVTRPRMPVPSQAGSE